MTRFLAVLKHLVTFSGRARRREFWLIWLVCSFAGSGLREIGRTYHDSAGHLIASGPLGPLAALGHHWPTVEQVIGLITAVLLLAAMSRRLHDIGMSARWLLLVLSIPVGIAIIALTEQGEFLLLMSAGPLILGCLALRSGEAGENRYGPDPKPQSSAPDRPDPDPADSSSATGRPMSGGGLAVAEPIRWFVVCLRRYATFAGRARRREFWWFIAVTVVLGALVTLLDDALHTPGSDPVDGGWFIWFARGGLAFHLFSLAMLVPTMAVCCRRMHDTNRSGAYGLLAPFTALMAIPGMLVFPVLGIAAGLLGPVIVAALAALNGTAGPNRYGPDPDPRPSPSRTSDVPQQDRRVGSVR